MNAAVPRFLFGLIFLSMLALALNSCLSDFVNKPDLKALYGAATKAKDQPPVIVIHGVLGSKLRDVKTGKEIWPGTLIKLASNNYAELELPINPETLEPIFSETEVKNNENQAASGMPDHPKYLQAYDITNRTAGRDFYGQILEVLEDAGGFKLAKAGKPASKNARNYYIFYYDWREDNVKTAAKLKTFITQIRQDYQAPNLKVDIIAHSMGGLVARYYLRYGDTDVLDNNDFPVNLYGASTVRRVILLGTPNLGSVAAIRVFLEGAPMGWRKMPTEVLATMPSAYQLFPHAINNWIISGKGEMLDRDLFDVELWKRFEWSIFDPDIKKRIINNKSREYYQTLTQYFEKQLERARRFVWSLTVPLGPGHNELIVFGGNCVLTPARILVEEVEGHSVVRLYPDEIQNKIQGIDYVSLMLEPGDGIVTKASLLAKEELDPAVPRHKYSFFPLDYSFFLCVDHDKLTSNISFQDNLLHAILQKSR